MTERFLKLIPSPEAMYLLTQKGHAFRLLTIIAEAARRYEGGADGLRIGEALIGGYENYDMTEQNYRTAKEILVRRQHIEIVETCRTRKKVTTGVTTVGTRVRLLSSTVYDINSEEGNDRPNDRPTTDPRPSNDELRKNKKDISNDISNKEEAQSAARLRSRKDLLTFNFETWAFEGITPEDRNSWSFIYPNVVLDVEITKSIEWLKANRSKSNKKNWRKYLTGWLQRANENLENKKAFKAAGSFGSPVDRRTKNMDGTPIKSKAEELF